MRLHRYPAIYSFLRAFGSLWLATLLLVVLLVALGSATVFESINGTEHSRAVFYGTHWFEAVVGLLALNVLAAVLVRLPLEKRHIGFAITHASILVILAGAVVTRYFGIEGTLGIAEGQTAEAFTVQDAALAARNRAGGTQATISLGDVITDEFRAAELHDAPVLTLENMRVTLDQYLPDSEYVDKVEPQPDDTPQGHAVVSVSLSRTGRDDTRWLLPQRPTPLGATTVLFRGVTADELDHLLRTESATRPRPLGTVQITRDEVTYDVSIEDCLDKSAPVGDTGLTIRVLQYLPHASVSDENTVINLSPSPINPAVEIELTRGEITSRRFVFANYPDFRSMHATETLPDIRVTYALPSILPPQAPIEVLLSPTEAFYVRFAWEGTNPVTQGVSIGEPIDAPWPGKKFAVLAYHRRATIVPTLVEVSPHRDEPVPAVHVNVSNGKSTESFWVQRHVPYGVKVGEQIYDLVFGDRPIALPFSVKLDRFRVRHYPGTQRPRAFESHVTILDAATGGSQSRVISMNHPTSYGGYTFYQKSYEMGAQGFVTFLNVARDAGQPIIFAGYIALMIGMFVVLITRGRAWRDRAAACAAEE